MEFGFGVLHLTSKDFWAMTPHEIGAAMARFNPSFGAPKRAALNALLHAFPDE